MLFRPMELKETHSSSRYGKPPWLFRGSALYQLHLVKAETARAFIPKEFRLVEAFGYTLGGFFLASYDDSPAGTFDELVVIAGIVWNPPTSCAWAARVLVNSGEACAHGRKDVGLPSQVARFSKVPNVDHKMCSMLLIDIVGNYASKLRLFYHQTSFRMSYVLWHLVWQTVRAIPRTSKTKKSGFLDMVGAFTSPTPKSRMDVQVSEIKGQTPMNICNINFSAAELDSSKWMGPLVKMSLPSFSGRTKYNPHLLKYSCQIECRVRTVPPAKVSGLRGVDLEEEKHLASESSVRNCGNGELKQNKRSLCISVMLSQPILALQFNCLKMKVEAPTMVSKHSQNSLRY